ncbi:MAG: sensor histidine kinase, partial [Acidimicrobiales bacterium]
MTQRVLGPIQNIVGFGRVLEQSTTATEAQRGIAHAISDSGRQLEQILGDALGVSLSTTGSLELDEEEVDVRDLMASVARSVRSRCIRNHLKFSLLLGPDLPKTVLTDTIKLRYLLQNMINEVIETTDAGGGVTLAAARWITPTLGRDEVRLSFEACGGEQAPSLEPGSPKARRAAREAAGSEHDRA